MFKIKAVNESNGKITDAIVNTITWIIMKVFMRGTVKKLNNLISKEDREELIKLHNKAEEASKKLEEFTSKMMIKREIESKRKSKIESKKIQTNKWKNQKKLNENKKLEENNANKEIDNEILNRILEKAIKDSESEITQVKELKEKITYFIKAAILITTIRKCSANLLSNKLKLNKNNAYYIIIKLEEAGIILDIYGKRNQKILVDDIEELETLLKFTDLNALFNEESIEEEE